MCDGVEVDDTGEELFIPVGRRSPISDILQDLGIGSIRIIEARSVN